MQEFPKETSSYRSPFDLPRNYCYENINDYHLKKTEQLIQVKNFELAVNELTGLLKCAKQTNNLKLASQLEDNLQEVKNLISRKNELRQALSGILNGISQFENTDSPEQNPLSDLLSSINNFLRTAKTTEEYVTLMEKIFNSNTRNIKDLKNFEAISKIKKVLEIILTFDPLKYLLELGKISLKEGENPFLLFDLDSTLFDNSPRVYKIIQDFIENHGHQYPDDIEKLFKLKREDIIWGIKENLNKQQIKNEEIVNHIIKFWFDRFFTNEYIIDLPLQGAKQFVKDAETAGIKIVYLTGRFESMKEGTAKNIIEHDFPLDEQLSNLLLKPDPKMADHVFKNEAMEKVKKMGDLIGGFDNEPLNANIFQEHFPDSTVFFLETNHSLNPPNLIAPVHTIPNFSYRE